MYVHIYIYISHLRIFHLCEYMFLKVHMELHLMISRFLQSHLREYQYDVSKGSDSISTREFQFINALEKNSP